MATFFLGAFIAWFWTAKSVQHRALAQAEVLTKAHADLMEQLRKQHAHETAAIRAESQTALSTALNDAARRHEASLEVDRQKIAQLHENQIKALETRHAEQIQKVESPLTVVVHPFVDTTEDKGMFKKSTTVEVGYKYQLMVQGIPCMEPHRMVVETQTKSEVDADAFKAFSEKALALAEAAVQVKGGPAAGRLFSVARTVLMGHKQI